MTVFKPHPNNVSTTLGSAYTAGSGSLVLAPGTGVRFGTTFPITVTVATAISHGIVNEVSSIYNVTDRSTDTLLGVSIAEGTVDRNYSIGDRVDVRWTDGIAKSIENAINTLEFPTWNYTLINSNTTINQSQTLNIIDTTSGPLTITLPSINFTGIEFLFIRLDALNIITIQRSGTDLIQPANSSFITLVKGKGKYYRLMALGNLGWYVVGSG